MREFARARAGVNAVNERSLMKCKETLQTDCLPLLRKFMKQRTNCRRWHLWKNAKTLFRRTFWRFFERSERIREALLFFSTFHILYTMGHKLRSCLQTTMYPILTYDVISANACLEHAVARACRSVKRVQERAKACNSLQELKINPQTWPKNAPFEHFFCSLLKKLEKNSSWVVLQNWPLTTLDTKTCLKIHFSSSKCAA